MIFLSSLIILLLPLAAQAQPAAASALTRAEQEEFLLKASIVSERPRNKYQSRITLDDGKRKHDANVETEDGTTATQRNYRFNVSAYELDKVLELNFLPPSIERAVNGRQASVTWWVDNVAMAEVDRRKKKIEPPDPQSWHQQMQAVRLFDELTANPYRNVGPKHPSPAGRDEGPPPDYEWGELLITRDWKLWLIDHTATFRTRKRLEHPQSLTQCDRALLRKLRQLNKEAFKQKLGKYLSSEQLDALEIRRQLLVKHFDELIATKGESAVLYDLPPRQ